MHVFHGGVSETFEYFDQDGYGFGIVSFVYRLADCFPIGRKQACGGVAIFVNVPFVENAFDFRFQWSLANVVACFVLL